MVNEGALEKMYRHLEYQAIGELWAMTLYPDEFDFPACYVTSYKTRIDLFCIVLEWLLRENKMRLACGGVFLEGTPEQQTSRFKQAFPEREEDFDDTIWWLLEDCPGGAVWYTNIDDHGFQTTPVGDGRFYYWT